MDGSTTLRVSHVIESDRWCAADKTRERRPAWFGTITRRIVTPIRLPRPLISGLRTEIMRFAGVAYLRHGSWFAETNRVYLRCLTRP